MATTHSGAEHDRDESDEEPPRAARRRTFWLDRLADGRRTRQRSAAAPGPWAAPIPRADRRAGRHRTPARPRRRDAARRVPAVPGPRPRDGRAGPAPGARSTPRAPAPATPTERPTRSGTGSGNTENSTNCSGTGPGNTDRATNRSGIGSGNTENSTNSLGHRPRQHRARRPLPRAPARATPRTRPTPPAPAPATPTARPTPRAPAPATPRTAPTMSEAGRGVARRSPASPHRSWPTVRAAASRTRAAVLAAGARPGGGRARTPSSGVCDLCPATHEIVPVVVARDRATSRVGDAVRADYVLVTTAQHIGVSGARSLNENSTGPCGRISIRHTAACDRCVRQAIPKSTPSAQATADFIGDTWLTTTMS